MTHLDRTELEDLFAGRGKTPGQTLVELRNRRSTREISKLIGVDPGHLGKRGEPIPRVSQQQIGKLENDQVDKPSMRDLVLLGKVYGKTPNEMAEIYGYWEPDEEDAEMSELSILKDLLDQLSPELGKQLLSHLNWSASVWLARQLNRVEG